MFVDSYTRTLPHYYSPTHSIDKLTGSVGDSNETIKCNELINNSILIRKPVLSIDELLWIYSTRFNIPHTTIIITTTEMNIPTSFSIDETLGYKLYIIFPDFVTTDDENILLRYVNSHVLDPNSEPIFRLYTHPKLSSTYSKRITFNLDFLDLLFERFKCVNISTPLTQNEIASYIATDRQFGAFESVEHYLNAYTVITAERL
jgi:hypothetical protein